MKTYTSIVSTQGQATIPAEVRTALGIQAGTTLVWEVKQSSRGFQVLLRVASLSAFKKLRGIGEALYKKHGGGAEHIQKERSSWGR